MKTYKSCDIILIPTKDSSNDESRIFCNSKNPNKFFNRKYNYASDTLHPIFYHLYITSDEEIEQGDYWIYINPKEWDLPQESIVKNNLPKEWFEKLWDRCNYKKIIATTDPLGKYIGVQLPQVPQFFISHYIGEYNKGNKIKKVEVEYEYNWKTNIDFDLIDSTKELIIKLNSDNTINIKSIKNWTREEVINKLEDFRNELAYNRISRTEFDKWIKENL